MSVSLHRDPRRLKTVVRDRILNIIVRGGMRMGDPLPSYRELCQRLDVSLMTVQRAMQDLAAEGWVASRQGRGAYVAREPEGAEIRVAQIGLALFCSHALFFKQDYLQEIFRGMMLEAGTQRIDMRIFSIRESGPIPPHELADSGVDAAVLCGLINEKYLERFERYEMPVVVVDSFQPNVALDYVTADNERAVREVLDHLIERGHRRIGYLDGYSNDPALGRRDDVVETIDVIERRTVYRKVMQERGLAEHVRVYLAHPNQVGYQAGRVIDAWTEHATRDTALLAYDNELAGSVIRAATDRKIHVPDELSVAGAAGARPLVVEGMTVTSSTMDFRAMGSEAVKALHKRQGHLRPLEAQRLMVGCSFVAGQSVAAPPAR